MGFLRNVFNILLSVAIFVGYTILVIRLLPLLRVWGGGDAIVAPFALVGIVMVFALIGNVHDHWNK